LAGRGALQTRQERLRGVYLPDLFRTWAEEVATVPHAVVEQAMGHQVGTQVERAYRRTDVLDKRRQLMETWAQWCEPKAAGNVIAFGKGGRS